jgi:hypothetical protein
VKDKKIEILLWLHNFCHEKINKMAPNTSLHLSIPPIYPCSKSILTQEMNLLSHLHYKVKKMSFLIKDHWEEEDPRWRLECKSRQHEFYKSKILLRHWSHTWHKKTSQEESKLQHCEPPACTKLLHAMLHWENKRVPMPPEASSKPAWETFSIPTGEHQLSRGIPTATPGINQHVPWTDWPPCPTKKKPE